MLLIRCHAKPGQKPSEDMVLFFPCTIGRSPKNTIVLDDPSVAEFHAVVEMVDRKLVFSQLSKESSTWLEEQAVTKLVVVENAQLKIGKIKVELVLDGKQKITPAAAAPVLEKPVPKPEPKAPVVAKAKKPSFFSYAGAKRNGWIFLKGSTVAAGLIIARVMLFPYQPPAFTFTEPETSDIPDAPFEVTSGAVAGKIARIDSNAGAVLVDIRRGGSLIRAALGEGVYVGDRIITSAEQSVSVSMADESEAIIGPSSDLTIRSVLDNTNQPTHLHLLYGMLHTVVNKIYTDERPFLVQTPTTVMGVRGTEFLVEQDKTEGASTLHTLEGAVAIGKSRDDLSAPAAHAVVAAGMTTSMDRSLAVPPPPKAFDRKTFFSSLAARLPLFSRQIEARRIYRQSPHQAASQELADLPAMSRRMEMMGEDLWVNRTRKATPYEIGRMTAASRDNANDLGGPTGPGHLVADPSMNRAPSAAPDDASLQPQLSMTSAPQSLPPPQGALDRAREFLDTLSPQAIALIVLGFLILQIAVARMLDSQCTVKRALFRALVVTAVSAGLIIGAWNAAQILAFNSAGPGTRITIYGGVTFICAFLLFFLLAVSTFTVVQSKRKLAVPCLFLALIAATAAIYPLSQEDRAGSQVFQTPIARTIGTLDATSRPSAVFYDAMEAVVVQVAAAQSAQNEVLLNARPE